VVALSLVFACFDGELLSQVPVFILTRVNDANHEIRFLDVSVNPVKNSIEHLQGESYELMR
jgi:hypothetical protein